MGPWPVWRPPGPRVALRGLAGALGGVRGSRQGLGAWQVQSNYGWPPKGRPVLRGAPGILPDTTEVLGVLCAGGVEFGMRDAPRSGRNCTMPWNRSHILVMKSRRSKQADGAGNRQKSPSELRSTKSPRKTPIGLILLISRCEATPDEIIMP